MSWAMTITNPSGQVVTRTVSNPELSDVDREEFTQGRGITTSKRMFVQDHNTKVRFIEAAWTFLFPSERAALEEFFGRDGSNRMARKFRVDIDGTHRYAQVIKAGMVVDGAVIKAGQFKFGERVKPTVTVLQNVRLDQPTLSFVQERNDQFAITLRFRIES